MRLDPAGMATDFRTSNWKATLIAHATRRLAQHDSVIQTCSRLFPQPARPCPGWLNENSSQQGLHISRTSTHYYRQHASWLSKQSENAADLARIPLEREGKSSLNLR